jgi:hypothetical protein
LDWKETTRIRKDLDQSAAFRRALQPELTRNILARFSVSSDVADEIDKAVARALDVPFEFDITTYVLTGEGFANRWRTCNGQTKRKMIVYSIVVLELSTRSQTMLADSLNRALQDVHGLDPLRDPSNTIDRVLNMAVQTSVERFRSVIAVGFDPRFSAK